MSWFLVFRFEFEAIFFYFQNRRLMDTLQIDTPLISYVDMRYEETCEIQLKPADGIEIIESL